MLVIRTGKPGHGKTLNTIREVDQKAHAEGRVVYFHTRRNGLAHPGFVPPTTLKVLNA